MGSCERSREQIAERLSGLELAYGSFPVNQTTVTLPAARFERVRERYGNSLVTARVKVRNDDSEILHLTGSNRQPLPSVEITTAQRLEQQARAAVAEQTGVECAIDDLERATITGVRNAETANSCYHLVVVLAGNKEGGVANDSGTWTPIRVVQSIPTR